MRILFITPSMEPGKDGVGDYTQRLAEGLRERGVQVLCLSLADRFVTGKSSSHPDKTIRTDASGVFRISAEISWSKRISILQEIISSYQPDWISLQYVPYGFDNKGLPLFLAKRLNSLKGSFRWHIMFHELWIGVEAGYSFFQKIVGWIQKKIVRDLLVTTNALVHSSNNEYVSRIQRLGFTARLLPLFSNIPVSKKIFSKRDVLQESLINPDRDNHSPRWVLALFGAIYPEWSPHDLFKRIDSLRATEGRPPCLVLVLGRSNERMVNKVSEECLHLGWTMLRKSDLSPLHISNYLRTADFGLATSPLSLLGKSGSVAAMIEHGLPVVVNRIDSGGDHGNRGFILFDHSFERNFLSAHKKESVSSFNEITDSFLSVLRN